MSSRATAAVAVSAMILVAGCGADDGHSANSPTLGTGSAPTASDVMLNVQNGGGRLGVASCIAKVLSAQGFAISEVLNAPGGERAGSSITYGSGAETVANALASKLGMTATKAIGVKTGIIELIAGNDAATIGPIAACVK
ncbi:LytR C-terminal domain-containing protein [Nocardia sp. NPDC049149]|uniref:LytR C-terminal domain-containing protein n=1 Tax=Nocardia sp. NPDC049149 TaxID=3364315 RepID=UPI00371DB81A